MRVLLGLRLRPPWFVDAEASSSGAGALGAGAAASSSSSLFLGLAPDAASGSGLSAGALGYSAAGSLLFGAAVGRPVCAGVHPAGAFKHRYVDFLIPSSGLGDDRNLKYMILSFLRILRFLRLLLSRQILGPFLIISIACIHMLVLLRYRSLLLAVVTRIYLLLLIQLWWEIQFLSCSAGLVRFSTLLRNGLFPSSSDNLCLLS